MIPLFRREFAIACTLLLVAANSTHLASAADPADGDVTDVRIIDELPPDGPYERIWQPFIARWSDRRYVVTYGLQLRAKPDMGDIVCSISNDRGETWTPPIMIFDHRVPNGTVNYAYNNSVLFKDPNQDVLWCYAMRCPQSFPNSEDSQLCAAYSGDGGYSWHPVELVMDYHLTLITCAGIVPVTTDGKTRYLLPVHRNTKRHDPRGTRDQFVLESTDLLHWKLSGYVPQPTDRDVFIHEGGIAAGGEPGELKMVMRTATYDRERVLDPPIAYSTLSRDGGRTWSTATPEPDLPNYKAKSFYGRDATGRLLYIYSDNADRHGLLYKVRAPGGNWSEPRVFFHANTRNSYPTLIEESPGQWLCVWDSSTDPERKRTAIRFGRLNTTSDRRTEGSKGSEGH